MEGRQEDIDIKECLEINIILLKSIGIWVPRNYKGTIKEYLCRLYAYYNLVLFVYLPLICELTYVGLIFQDGNIVDIIDGMLLTLSHGTIVIKSKILRNFNDDVRDLVDVLEDPMFKRVHIGSHPQMLSVMRVQKHLFRFFVVCAIGTASLWGIFPLLGSGDEIRMPFEWWFPFDTTVSPQFELMYAYQVVGTLYLVVLNVAQDTLPSGLMAMACGQLDYLADKLSDKHRLCGTDNLSDEDKKQLNKETRKHLIECIKHHATIIRFVKEIERIFWPCAFVQLSAGCIAVCATAFKISVIPLSVEMFSMVLYMMCLLIEAFVYCYFGNELIIKSLHITEAAYASMWYIQSIQNRKLLFLLMERAKRPLQVTAGIFAMSLSTFSTILRSSYSLFAVLRQVNDR